MVAGFRSFAGVILFIGAALCPKAYALDAPAIPGFPDNAVALSGRAIEFSAPTIADIDGDPSNGKEIAVEGADGVLYVLTAQGALLWSAQLPTYGCKAASNNKAYSSPAVGALNGDGIPYVVAGYGGLGGRACDGGLVAYRGSDGQKAWTFSLKAFSKKEQFGTLTHGVFSSPAVADTDGDGKMEIAFGSFDRNVYLLNSNGSVRWYYNAADTIWSSPAFADINGDGILELIIGTDISANSRLKPITKNGGFVYAFKTAAKSGKSKRYFFRDKKAYYWATYLDQVVYSAPIIADVIPESAGNEVIVASGCFFPQRSDNKKGKWVKVLNLKTGKVLKTLTAPACSSASPAVGDIDDDGILEIVATVNGSTSVGGDGSSRVVAWKASSSTPLWSVIPPGRDSFGGHFQSAVIADLDENGSLEVALANGSSVHLLAGRDGSLLGSLSTGRSLKGTPAIGDINEDGSLDLVIGGGTRSSKAALYGWSGFEDILGSAPGSQSPGAMPWPMYRGNSQHTSLAE